MAPSVFSWRHLTFPRSQARTYYDLSLLHYRWWIASIFGAKFYKPNQTFLTR